MTYNQWLKKVDEEMHKLRGTTFTRHNIRPFDYLTAYYDQSMTPEDAAEEALEANDCAMLWEMD